MFSYNDGIAMSYCNLMVNGEGSWNQWICFRKYETGAQ